MTKAWHVVVNAFNMHCRQKFFLSLCELRPSVPQVLLPEVWRGLLGFWLWWSVLVWFLSGLLGVAYQRYFTTA